jgi:hypothetical protein
MVVTTGDKRKLLVAACDKRPGGSRAWRDLRSGGGAVFLLAVCFVFSAETGKLICTHWFKQNCMFARRATLLQSRSAQRPAWPPERSMQRQQEQQRRRPSAAESQQSRLWPLPQTFQQARYNRDCDHQPTSGLNKRACVSGSCCLPQGAPASVVVHLVVAITVAKNPLVCLSQPSQAATSRPQDWDVLVVALLCTTGMYSSRPHHK